MSSDMRAEPAAFDTAGYGVKTNAALLQFMQPVRGTVLDIGAGAAAWAPALRRLGADRVWAIEPSVDAAVAREQCDNVYAGGYTDAPRSLYEGADIVVLADVLEHLIDPWSALDFIRQRVNAETRLIISTPNAQYARFLLRVLATGDFFYRDDGGFLDRGHIRWFTQRTLVAALGQTGWSVQRVGGKILGTSNAVLVRSLPHSARCIGAHQIHIDARAEKAAVSPFKLHRFHAAFA